MTPEAAEEARSRLAEKLGIPVVLPLRDDLNDLVEIIKNRIDPGRAL
jgi:predicted RecB family endonuclease